MREKNGNASANVLRKFSAAVADASPVLARGVGKKSAAAPASCGPKTPSTRASSLDEYALSPDEEQRVSAKIKKLVGEGKPHDQAVAEAIAIEAPSKSKSRKSAAATRVPAPPLSAKYTVRKEADGKIRVCDVPIFGENTRDFGDEVVSYDSKWLSGALETDQQLRAGGYRAPMHFGHHEPGVERLRAGEIELKGVGRRVYMGRARAFLFADLIFDDEQKFEKFKREYVYRSVEISPEKPGEINSLALLASEAPYFRFPIPKQFTFAFRALPGGGSAFMWRAPMGQENETPTAAAPAALNTVASAFKYEAEPEKKPAEFATEENPAEEDAAEPPAEDPNAKLFAAFDARMKRLEAALGLDNDGDADDRYAAEHAEPDGDEAAPGLKKTQKAPPVVAAAARGETLALRARVEALESDLREKDLMAKYEAELAPWLATPQIRAELHKCVKQGDAVAKAFATALRSVKPARPRASEGAPSETIQDAPEVAKYAAKGPNVLAEARRMAAVYTSSPKGHFVRSHSLEAWLRSNVGEV